MLILYISLLCIYEIPVWNPIINYVFVSTIFSIHVAILHMSQNKCRYLRTNIGCRHFGLCLFPRFVRLYSTYFILPREGLANTACAVNTFHVTTLHQRLIYPMLLCCSCILSHTYAFLSRLDPIIETGVMWKYNNLQLSYERRGKEMMCHILISIYFPLDSNLLSTSIVKVFYFSQYAIINVYLLSYRKTPRMACIIVLRLSISFCSPGIA